MQLTIEKTICSSQKTTVYVVRDADNQRHALKITEDVPQFEEKYAEYVELDHQNVCKISKICVRKNEASNKNTVMQLMEYANYGDLKGFIQSYIDSRTKIPLSTITDFIT